MKKSKKRIWSGIIIAIVSTILMAVILTKGIYDSTFRRYDGEEAVPAALTALAAEREECSFQSGENRLYGALYRGDREGLVVIAPGYRAGTEDYLWQIKSLRDYGWGVFIFDNTGSCRSEGSSAVGFPQALLDLEAALQYIESEDRFGYREILLLGHSRGGYAVCGMLDEGYDIAAAVTVSGVNSCMEAILQPVADKIGAVAYSNYPLLWLYQTSLFGWEAVETEAAEAIARAEVPVLIVQGTEDAQYPPEKYSVYSHREEFSNSDVSYYLCDTPGQNGHTDLLFGEEGANGALMAEINDFFALNLEER